MTSLRPLLRQVAYRSGMLSLGRASARHALTAVMFHRVIDPADPDYAQADPIYTVSAPLFEQLLGFFRDHYEVVDIQRVLDASDGVRPLPDDALLITFDDGWADNYRYAAPLLHAHGLPAVIFVAAEAVQAAPPAWWQEEVFALARSGTLSDFLARDDRRGILGTAAGAGSDQVEVVTRLALMEPDARERILAGLPRIRCRQRMMMDGEELRSLADYGIAVGLHGHRHVPLTSLGDVRGELANAARAVTELSEGAAVTTVLACPHGLYDDRVIAQARSAGMRLIFTSDKLLNATEGGMLARERPLGRIGIAAAHVAAAPHRLDRAAAARWLWPRACR